MIRANHGFLASRASTSATTASIRRRRGQTHVGVIVTPVRIDLRGWTGDVPGPSEATRGDETPWCGVRGFELRDTDSD